MEGKRKAQTGGKGKEEGHMKEKRKATSTDSHATTKENETAGESN